MKKFISTIVLSLSMAIIVYPQTVQVTQDFVDSANKSFIEVIALRKAVDAQTETIKAKDETIKAKNDAITAKDAALKDKDDELVLYKKMKCSTGSVLFILYRYKQCG